MIVTVLVVFPGRVRHRPCRRDGLGDRRQQGRRDQCGGGSLPWATALGFLYRVERSSRPNKPRTHIGTNEMDGGVVEVEHALGNDDKGRRRREGQLVSATDCPIAVERTEARCALAGDRGSRWMP